MPDTTPADNPPTEGGGSAPTPSVGDAASAFAKLMEDILADAGWWVAHYPTFLGSNPPQEFIEKYLPLFAPFTDPAHLEAVVFGAWKEITGQEPRGYNQHHGMGA